MVTGDGGSMGFGAGGAGSAGEYTTIGTILIRPSLASYRMPTRKNPPDILCLTGSCTILAVHGFEYSLSSVPNMVVLIRFGGRVNYVDLVSSSFVEESLQALGGIRVSIRRSLVAAGERPVAT